MSARDYSVHVEPLSGRYGGGYVAYVPDLPGCKSDGETPEEAVHNVYDAIECWIERAARMGRAIPEPTREHQFA